MRKFFKIPGNPCLKGFLVVMLGLLFAASAYGQQVSLRFKDTAIRTILKEIEAQTDFTFIYSNNLVDVNKRVSVEIVDAQVGKALQTLLSGTKIGFRIVESQIILSPKSEEQPAKEGFKVKGVVFDASTNERLPGVSVVVDGTNVNTTTDLEGYFEIIASEKATLSFMMLGMMLENVDLLGREELIVYMEPDYLSLEEVVVTGYQEVSKNQSTSAVASIKAESLKTIGITSIDQALQGQLAGLSVINSGTGPGSAPKVRIRGTATIIGNAEPLWVLDGVILENSVPVTSAELNSPDFMNTFNSAIGGVSPNDIESITVLKDASATAIYGTRAANGVIVVTTKKGKRNSSSISYNHTSRLSIRPTYNDFDLLNSKERVQLTMENSADNAYSMFIYENVGMEGLLRKYYLNEISREDFTRLGREMEERNTDWFELLFRNAYTQTHDLSFSGGSSKTDYYVSVGFNDEQGMDKVSNYRSYNTMAKVNTELFKGVRFGATLQAGIRERDSYHQSIDPFTYAVRTSRTIPVFDQFGDYYLYESTQAGSMAFNILKEQKSTSRESLQSDLKSLFNLDINVLPGLKYRGLFSYAISNSAQTDHATEMSAHVAGIRGYNYGQYTDEQFASSKLPYGGVYNERNFTQRTYILRNGLEYKKTLAKELDIDLMVGQEFRNTEYKGLIANSYGYLHDRGNIYYQPPLGAETGHLARNTVYRNLLSRAYVSYYGVFSAIYRNRYVLNGNVRFDGSNLFGSNPDYRYLPLWSFSGKWILSNEPFLENSSVVSNLQLRGSFGLRGNIVEESTPQIVASALPPNPSTGELEMEIIQAPNPDLKWETTESVNIGLEFGLFNNRVSGVVDYFRDLSSDLIAYKNISSVSGFPGKYLNYADVRNSGVDLSLNVDIVRKKDIGWTSSLNLGYVDNKVLRSSINPEVSSLVGSQYIPGDVVVGYPVNSMFSYKFAKLNGEGTPMFYDKEGNVVDSSSDGIIDLVNDISALKYEGNREPLITGGFNNIFRYKNFTVSALFSFALKSVVRLPDMAYTSPPGGDRNANRSIMGRWRKPGDEANTIIPGFTGTSYFTVGGKYFYTTSMFNSSDATTVSGDYLRFRNLTVEYQLPESVARKILVSDKAFKGISFRFQAQNIFVLADKKLKGYDPETVNYSVGGYGSMPMPRTFTIGLSLNM